MGAARRAREKAAAARHAAEASDPKPEVCIKHRTPKDYVADSWIESVRGTASGHNGHSGVAYAIGGGLVNVPATSARGASPLWRTTRRSKAAPPAKQSPSTDALDVLLAK
jgi:hypothetical protein